MGLGRSEKVGGEGEKRKKEAHLLRLELRISSLEGRRIIHCAIDASVRRPWRYQMSVIWGRWIGPMRVWDRVVSFFTHTCLFRLFSRLFVWVLMVRYQADCR